MGHIKPGVVVIEMSTIHPLETDRIRSELYKADVAMVDTPLGRTALDAKDGKSLIMVGGTPEHLAKCQPTF